MYIQMILTCYYSEHTCVILCLRLCYVSKKARSILNSASTFLGKDSMLQISCDSRIIPIEEKSRLDFKYLQLIWCFIQFTPITDNEVLTYYATKLHDTIEQKRIWTGFNPLNGFKSCTITLSHLVCHSQLCKMTLLNNNIQ